MLIKQKQETPKSPGRAGTFHLIAMPMPKTKIKVAIQGIATSYHHVAAQAYFGRLLKLVECHTFRDVCEKLKQGEADFAVMAIENSIAGSILPNYFLLQDYHFSIVGELYLPIHMHLLALHGVKLEQIKCIESHPMAIRQCSEYLHRLNGIEIKESDDTALSARKIKTRRLKDTAALGNELTAKKFGLQILERRIETHKKNFTRFLILSRKTKAHPASNKASLSFEVAHEVGSLADVLLTFKENHINLTKIQSIPIIGKPTEYSIHVDVEWTKRRHYNDALHAVLRKVKNLNVLGEYKKAVIKF